ncbi:signal recognition particle protein [Ferruginivarius sediminum]|uniref:Signal recognition particle protein n=1 Tax=Ferruginivarius sediminum TaxID=2661937 RepID=A0A369TDU2_9PROT|nr:signal recognition particle protein [Ferruginivarius sediminum]RDD63499.1 signal recognition particle protein [Ferruginivarius sediminum]
MFDSLQERLGKVFEGLSKVGTLNEKDVDNALREVRVALLEADVALPVVKQFVADLRERAVGQEVLRSVTPGQQVVKIVHDRLAEMLGGEQSEIQLRKEPPTAIMLVGLQGSGKTTTTGKIAKRLKEKQKQKVLMASLDVRRPAAQDQLRQLGWQVGVDTLDNVPGEPPKAIAKRALQKAALEGYDVVLLDTAGRLSIDQELMDEVKEVEAAAKPSETLLVADSMTGQDAVTTAQNFQEAVELTGIVLTRVDGDARGGAALSMRQVTGRPIKLIGVGEKLDALEAFHPDRIANRILGMGDVVSLVEKAQESFEEEQAQKLQKKLEKGKFDLDDLAQQFRQLQKMGGMQELMGMIPGLGKMGKQVKNAQFDEKAIGRQLAIISSMTKNERRRPEIIKASRKQRIARGSGTTVQDVNKLLKQFTEAQRMMKRVKKMGKKGLMRHGLPGMGGGGGGMPGGGMPGGGFPGGFPGGRG